MFACEQDFAELYRLFNRITDFDLEVRESHRRSACPCESGLTAKRTHVSDSFLFAKLTHVSCYIFCFFCQTAVALGLEMRDALPPQELLAQRNIAPETKLRLRER